MKRHKFLISELCTIACFVVGVSQSMGCMVIGYAQCFRMSVLLWLASHGACSAFSTEMYYI